MSVTKTEMWNWNMQKLPVMGHFKWHVVYSAQDHTRPHMFPGSNSELTIRQKPAADFCLRATGVLFDTLHLKALWPDQGKTHRYGSRPWGPVTNPMRTASSKWNRQHFWAHICLSWNISEKDYKAFQVLMPPQNRFIHMWESSCAVDTDSSMHTC